MSHLNFYCDSEYVFQLCADDKINSYKKCCKNDFCNTPGSSITTSTSTTKMTTPSTMKTSPTTGVCIKTTKIFIYNN